MADPNQNEIRAQRLANMRRLAELGYTPYGQAFRRTARLAETRAAFQENAPAALAGRLVLVRDMGKSIFADLRDGTDRFQIYAQKNAIGDAAFEAFKLLDVGDHIGVEGTLFTTRTGELTLKIERWTMLSKALLALPEKWHGLRDVEARYRQRYLDLIANPDVREIFNKRIRAIDEIRRFLVARGFSEVETPMMQPMAGGAAARPFVTQYTALDATMYLRIAPELYLKRLLVGGFDKVFELNRNFRNEGLSRTHNPEFTMLEVYEAYGDVQTMKALVQDMVSHVAQTVFGTLRCGQGESVIDLTPPWREVTYRDLILGKMGAGWYELPVTEARARAEAIGLPVAPNWTHAEITHEIYEKAIERTLQNPTFVTRLPAALVPLAKRCPDDPSVVDVFELVIGGKEVAPGYSELNDPLDQRERFTAQTGPDAGAVDEDFLAALAAMPEASGVALGFDRLVMLSTGAERIEQVLWTPVVEI